MNNDHDEIIRKAGFCRSVEIYLHCIDGALDLILTPNDDQVILCIEYNCYTRDIKC